jgi:hypothetical protein
MSVHHCEAVGCGKRTAPDNLMCAPHWRMVPTAIKALVYAAWGRGTGAGTQAHIDAKRRAIEAVAKLEGRSAA